MVTDDSWGSKLTFSKDDGYVSLSSGYTYNGDYMSYEVDIVSLWPDEVEWFLVELEKSKNKPVGYESVFEEKDVIQ